MPMQDRSRMTNNKIAERANKKDMYCGGITHDNNNCVHPRGMNTDHAGEGRCWQHDGYANGSPVALYRIPAIKERMEDFQNDRNIYSLDREIALNRAYLELYHRYIAVFKELNLNEQKELNLNFSASELTSAVVSITKNIARLVQTKHEIEVGRKFVIDIRVVEVMFDKVGNILDANIKDPGVRTAISNALGNIMLPLPTGKP